MFCWSLWAAINLLIPITPQKSCHLGVKKQHLHLVWAQILMQQLPLCGRTDVTSDGAGWLPFSHCGCWRWPNMERDAALKFSFMVWILKKSWLLFGIFSPLIEQRGDTIMSDRRWNTSVATYIGKLFVWIKKNMQISGSKKKCFMMNSGSFLEACMVFLSMIFITHLDRFHYFYSSRDLLCLYFPCW